MKQKPQWVFKKTVDFYNHYTLDVRLGGGAYGKVFKCIHKESKDVRAVKVIQKYQFAQELDLFRHEISIMKELDHAHLIKFYGVYETSKFLFIVMELCEGGELFTYMRQKFAPKGIVHKCCPCFLSMCGLVKTNLYTEKEASHWMRQVCEGLAYLHSKRIVHADIKPQNIMLKHDDKNSSIRIIDFGLSSAVKKKHLIRGQDGTPEFMAPEVVKGKYTFHSDMWSFGVLIFTMLFGFSPFWTQSVCDTYKLIVDYGFCPDKPTDGFGNSFPGFLSCSDDAKDLIVKLLQQDPIKRLSAQEALEHKWFSQATDTPIEHPVVQHLHQIQERSKLQRLVLNMILKTVDEKEIDDIQHDFSDQIGGELNQSHEMDKLKRELFDNPVRSPTPSMFHRHNPQSKKGLEVVIPVEPDKTDDLPHDERFHDINMKDLIIAAVEHRLLAKEERLWNCFDIIDSDGNGAISAEELSQGLSITLDQARAIIAEADANGDGCIDLDEFVEQFLSFDNKFTQCACENWALPDCASPVCKFEKKPKPIPIPKKNDAADAKNNHNNHNNNNILSTIGLPGAVSDGNNISLDAMTLKIPTHSRKNNNNAVYGDYSVRPGTPLAMKLANYQSSAKKRNSFTKPPISINNHAHHKPSPLLGSITSASPLPYFYFNGGAAGVNNGANNSMPNDDSSYDPHTNRGNSTLRSRKSEAEYTANLGSVRIETTQLMESDEPMNPLDAELTKDVLWQSGKYHKITKHINEKTTNILYNQLAEGQRKPLDNKYETADELPTTPILNNISSSSPSNDTSNIATHEIVRNVATKTRNIVQAGAQPK